ncbi:MAG: DNA repair protein RecN [Chloroflexota bacterium]
MLHELAIENFAIIERLLVRCEPGFTVLTGETGAGKSIIIDALQTALGSRVSADVVRSGTDHALVEAIFDRPDAVSEQLSGLLADQGIEDQETLILRREVLASGRTTARINGRAVPVSVLSAVGSLLVDIHGQSEHLSILRRDRQLDVLDRFADLLPLRERVSAEIGRYSRLREEVIAVTEGRREGERRLDLLRFQVQEIESASLDATEEDRMHAERTLLANAEKLALLSGSAYESLNDDAVSEHVAGASVHVHDLLAIDPSLGPLAERIDSVQVELDDIAQELRRYRDSIEFDPRRLAALEERADVLSGLKRKYGSTVSQIIDFGQAARRDMEDIENVDDRLRALEQEACSAADRAGVLACDLSRARSEAAAALSRELGEALQGLNLKETRFKAEVQRHESPDGIPFPGRTERYAYTQNGVDAVRFLVAFNAGEPLRPMEKVASGGETSRFLLALKSVLARADRTPTLVFDEVDVGVGGRAGVSVGERLRALGVEHQVLSITHLPQVAALAQHHLAVTKVVAGGRTGIEVRNLSGAQRVEELAHMMSGTGSDAARRSAAELLESAQTRP